MKKIVIDEWLKFINLPSESKKDLIIQNVYRHGYWNVMYHNQPLEDFLIRNKIEYTITEKSLL